MNKSELKKKHIFTLKRKTSWTITAEKKKEQGCIVKVESVYPIGWVVSSYIWIKLDN